MCARPGITARVHHQRAPPAAQSGRDRSGLRVRGRAPLVPHAGREPGRHVHSWRPPPGLGLRLLPLPHPRVPRLTQRRGQSTCSPLSLFTLLAGGGQRPPKVGSQGVLAAESLQDLPASRAPAGPRASCPALRGVQRNGQGVPHPRGGCQRPWGTQEKVFPSDVGGKVSERTRPQASTRSWRPDPNAPHGAAGRQGPFPPARSCFPAVRRPRCPPGVGLPGISARGARPDSTELSVSRFRTPRGDTLMGPRRVSRAHQCHVARARPSGPPLRAGGGDTALRLGAVSMTPARMTTRWPRDSHSAVPGLLPPSRMR